jgi:hypothetical protein
VEHFDLDHRALAFPHSDAGVRAEFFKEMRDTWQLQVSFGTAGAPALFPAESGAI